MPSHIEELKKVPADQVGEVTQSFADSGAAKVQATRAADGTWTVKATFSH